MIVSRLGQVVGLVMVLLAGCTVAAPGAPSPPPLQALSPTVPGIVSSPLGQPASAPAAGDLARYQPWTTTGDEAGQRLVTAFDRALASIAAGFLTENRTTLGGGVIGPRHVAEWAEIIAGVRAGPYRLHFRWDYRVHPVVWRDPTADPIAYRLIVAVVDRSERLARATGQPVATGEAARGCLFVALHEEGGTLKVIAMQRVVDRLCDQGWPP